MGDKVSVTLETSLKVCQGILEVTLTRLQEQQSSRQSAPR
jgi:hypothetical protein